MANATQPVQDSQPQGAGQDLDLLLRHVALAQATDLARAGRYEPAESILAEWTHRQEPLPAALDLLARIRAQQGRLAEAEAYWTRALQLDPGNAAYAAGLRRIAHLQRSPLRRTPWPAVAALAAAGLVLAGGGLLGRQVGRLEGAVAGLADRAAALEQHIERVAQPSLQPTPEPDLAGPVRRALEADAELAPLGLSVRQVGAGVSLSGTAPSLALKQRAEALARGVAGVTLVDGSGLTVAPPPLAEAVREAIRTDARTAGLDIRVEQVGSGVRLEGTAPTLEARLALEQVARAVPGVELADATGVRVEPAPVEHIVRWGDTLASIARQYYGDAALWRLIYESNRDRIHDANAIQPGMRLIIPPSAP